MSPLATRAPEVDRRFAVGPLLLSLLARAPTGLTFTDMVDAAAARRHDPLQAVHWVANAVARGLIEAAPRGWQDAGPRALQLTNAGRACMLYDRRR